MKKSFYYVETKSDTLFHSELCKEMKVFVVPLIWHREGLYKIFSLQQIENLFKLQQDMQKLSKLNKSAELGFHWDEGINLDAKIAKLLLGQQ